jgi:hypothetical protein
MLRDLLVRRHLSEHDAPASLSLVSGDTPEAPPGAAGPELHEATATATPASIAIAAPRRKRWSDVTRGMVGGQVS